MQKSNLLIGGFSDDVKFFKEIQMQYREEGKNVAALFHDILEAFKNKNSK